VDQLFHLRFGGRDHLRIAVAGVDDRDAGKAIEIFAAVDIGDGAPLAVSITMGTTDFMKPVIT
jgi:hypothetical protein